MKNERLDGIWQEGKRWYRFHIERKSPTDNTKGIQGGRIMRLELYVNDELVAEYNRGWRKQGYKKHEKLALEKLIKKYN